MPRLTKSPMPWMTAGWPLPGLAVGALALLLGGCGGPAAKSAEEINASYEQALARTAPLAVEVAGGDEGARQALTGAEDLFGEMTGAAIRAKVGAVYAPDAYLNDNLAVVQGAPAIGEYFARTAGRVRALRVAFLGVTHAGPDYFARWRMTVESPRLNDGAPMVSYGMTHFRFDGQGRILVHKDFWDAGTGLYEYLPVLRPVLRTVRATAG